MDKLLEGSEQLELELGSAREPMVAPAAGSLLLHGALAGSIILYGVMGGLFHHNDWGGAGGGGAIQVKLTSALPLPSDQPPNENVLATETPSQAPAEAAPKTKEAVDQSALAITGKQKAPEQQNTRKTQPQPRPDNLAKYGEQAGSSMARATQAQGFTSGQTTVSDEDFGTRFGWYVSNSINPMMSSNWIRGVVDPRTPKGTRAYIQFTIHRDGSVSDAQIDHPSGYPTLDRSCLYAALRVGHFEVLPSAYNSSTLKVSYYCEF
jgi:protein TonB